MIMTEIKHRIINLIISKIRTDGVASIREIYDIESLDGLGESLEETKGPMNPIVVEKISDDEYELIIGSRRLKASQRKGRKTIPAVVMEDLNDQTKLIMALSENIHHEDLTPFEEARVMLKLLSGENKITLRELSSRIGRKESAIRNRIRLLQLPPEVQDLMNRNLIGMTSIKVIESLKSPEEQARFAKITVDHLLNVQELSALLEKERQKKSGNRPPSRRPITGQKAYLRIVSFAGSIRRLMPLIMKMKENDLAKVKSALMEMKKEIDKWIEKIDTLDKPTS